METKKLIRQLQLEKLSSLKETWEKESNELSLYKALFATSAWKEARQIGVTISSSIEIDTKPIILQAQLQGKKICFPRTLPRRQMAFFELTVNTIIRKNNFGIYEPQPGSLLVPKEKIDLLLIPGLAFSLAGDRVSFGGGYYDRYLADYTGKKVALADPARLYPETTWETEETDQQISELITVKNSSK
ncbi:5-formyltetrahydrofolate cyclo-ligase [Liquorilactobacillus capillatus]|uniref:5-formyltetrahydrofolate cyclo-ligase n=1 Tax=Liquorilactobacillus capillatus DSM 19910 TaxID=1423731 RepID=A0A0R1M551_9LACO|nr:5-formyltetrahydrofolate cyclo-ligase [Liquorilactobacillus capillatus]KRL03231.1 5-formyltetrahydrofolate cyclo-ligase [Liquorilactobacillus capillatus DSM 19910]